MRAASSSSSSVSSVVPGDRLALDADLRGDRARRVEVVAGDHLHVDAGAPGGGDRWRTSARGGSSNPTSPCSDEAVREFDEVVDRRSPEGVSRSDANAMASTRSPWRASACRDGRDLLAIRAVEYALRVTELRAATGDDFPRAFDCDRLVVVVAAIARSP